MPPLTQRPLASVGAGNMGRAIIQGSLAAQHTTPDHWAVADASPHNLATAHALGLAAVPSIADLAPLLAGDALILLAIKPQHLPDAAHDLRALLAGSSRSLLSILAGTPVDALDHHLASPPRWTGSVIRAMPNTPASVRRGITALTIPDNAPHDHADLARALFHAVGHTVELPEHQIDPFTAVAGSGPAYLFAFTEALQAAAEHLGFDPATAATIAAHTVTGSAHLLHTDPRSPAELRAAVTSKNGTTASGLATLAEHNLNATLIAAADAANRRAAELADPSKH